MGTSVRGIRGAIDVSANSAQEILEATEELLREMARRNSIQKDSIAAVIFTLTADLNAVFPAEAARKMGWTEVPLFCASEIAVPGSLPRCIRLLMLVNTTKSPQEIQHVYLGGAVNLRKDLQEK